MEQEVSKEEEHVIALQTTIAALKESIAKLTTKKVEGGEQLLRVFQAALEDKVLELRNELRTIRKGVEKKGPPKLKEMKRQRDALCKTLLNRFIPSVNALMATCGTETIHIAKEGMITIEGGSTARGLDAGLSDLDVFIIAPLKNSLTYEFDEQMNVKNVFSNGMVICESDLLKISNAFHLAVLNFLKTRREHEAVELTAVGWRNKLLATFKSKEGFDFDFVLALQTSDESIMMIADGIDAKGRHTKPRFIMSDNIRSKQMLDLLENTKKGIRIVIKQMKAMFKVEWNKEVTKHAEEEEQEKARGRVEHGRYLLKGVHAETLACLFAKNCGEWNTLSNEEKVREMMRGVKGMLEKGDSLNPFNMPQNDLLEPFKNETQRGKQMKQWLLDWIEKVVSYSNVKLLQCMRIIEEIPKPIVISSNILDLELRLALLKQMEMKWGPQEILMREVRKVYMNYHVEGFSHEDSERMDRLNIKNAFVNLEIGEWGNGETLAKKRRGGMKENNLGAEEEQENRMQSVKIEDVWNGPKQRKLDIRKEYRRIVIQGEAGAGKTTALQFIAYEWAMGRLWNQFYALIHVRLKDIQKAKNLEEIIKFLLPYDEEQDKHVQDFLKWCKEGENASNVLWIFDGWDEIKVEGIFQRIKEGNEPCVRFMMAGTRPQSGSVIQCDWLLWVKGFDEQGQETFLRRYFGYWNIEERRKSVLCLIWCLKKKTYPKELCQIIVNYLLNTPLSPTNEAMKVHQLFEQQPTIKQACQIPLISRLVCVVMSSCVEGDTAIVSQMDLYRQVIEKMWKRSEKHELEYVPKQELRKIAWESFYEGTPNMEMEKIEQICKYKEKRIQSILKCGLIKEGTFLHFTFQEFLAAEYICEVKEDPQNLLTEIRDSKKEKSDIFFVFLSGIANQKKNDKLSDSLTSIIIHRYLFEKQEWSIQKVAYECARENRILRNFLRQNWANVFHKNNASWFLGFFDLREFVECVDVKLRTQMFSGIGEGGHVEFAKILIQFGCDADVGLRFACLRGQFELVKFLVSYVTDLENPTWTGFTNLMNACMNGHFKIIKFLVERGAEVNVLNDSGWSPLMIACEDGRVEVVNYLIEQGAELDAKNNDGRTPLMWAFIKQHLDTAKILLKYGANVNTEFGINTPMLAVANGWIEILEMFDMEKLKEKGKDGLTAWHVAMWTDQKECAKWLEEKGCVGERNIDHQLWNCYLNKECTFKQSGPQFEYQCLYNCDTCWPGNENIVCCVTCATLCHTDHALGQSKFGPGYCDCYDEGRCNID